MDKLTLTQVKDFVVVLAALLGFIVLVWNVIKAIREWRKPSDDMQAWRRDVDAKLNSDNNRLTDVETGINVILRSNLAMLSHEINGNSSDKLLQSQKEITDYLINR